MLYNIDADLQVSQEDALTAINAVRFLSIDAVNKANSGHPGMPMGCAPMAYLLWTEFMRHNPADPTWFDRDRFVLSAGHGSMLLYSLLHLSGYDSVSVSHRFFIFIEAETGCSFLEKLLRHKFNIESDSTCYELIWLGSRSGLSILWKLEIYQGRDGNWGGPIHE